MRPTGLALVLLALLAGPATAAPIEIGAVFSTTGAAKAYGTSQVRGAELAVEAINRSGQLHRRLALRVRDDASDGARAAAHFSILIKQGAQALLGPTLSSAAASAHPVAQDAHIPVIAVSNTVDGITDVGNYVFRNSLPESYVQPQTVAVTRARLGYTRAAIVWATPDVYSRGAHDAFAAALRAQEVAVVADAPFAAADDGAMRAAVDSAAAAAPDVLFVVALAADAARVIGYARGLPALAEVEFIGGNSLNTPLVLDAAGEAAEGLIAGSAWHNTRATPGNRHFVAAYFERYRRTPDQFAAQAYAGVQLIAEAIRRRSARPSAIRRELAGMHLFPTVLGLFSFQRREPLHNPVVVEVQGGGFVIF